MSARAAAGGRWDRVEFYTSASLLIVLASIILTRLGFDRVWHMPTLDFDLSVLALTMIAASVWLARHSQPVRVAIVAFAGATQLVPMLVRHPVLLVPVLGGLIPVSILVVCLMALSRKGRDRPTRS